MAALEDDGPVFKQVSQVRQLQYQVIQQSSLGQALVQEMFKLTLDPQTRGATRGGTRCWRVEAAHSVAPCFTASPAAVHLSSEYLRLFTREAIHRAAEVAKLEHDAQGGVTGPVLIEVSVFDASPSQATADTHADWPAQVRNLEKIVAGLLLDF